MVSGARQVGKTYAVRETLKPRCRELHTFNFEKSPSLARLFEGDLDPSQIIKKLALTSNRDIDPQYDVIFFDAPVFLIEGVDVEKIKCAA